MYAETSCFPTKTPSMSASEKHTLIGLWRKAVRCTARAGWQADITQVTSDLQLQHIEHRWALQLAVLVRRCHLQAAPIDLINKLQRSTHSYGTRGQGYNFVPYRPRSRSGSISFTNRAPLVWNYLPESFKETNVSLPNFKTNALSLVAQSPDFLSLLLYNISC